MSRSSPFDPPTALVLTLRASHDSFELKAAVEVNLAAHAEEPRAQRRLYPKVFPCLPPSPPAPPSLGHTFHLVPPPPPIPPTSPSTVFSSALCWCSWPERLSSSPSSLEPTHPSLSILFFYIPTTLKRPSRPPEPCIAALDLPPSSIFPLQHPPASYSFAVCPATLEETRRPIFVTTLQVTFLPSSLPSIPLLYIPYSLNLLFQSIDTSLLCIVPLYLPSLLLLLLLSTIGPFYLGSLRP